MKALAPAALRAGFLLLLAAITSACGSSAPDASDSDTSLDHLPYAQEVVSFSPGNNAGYGASRLPDVVLGPPQSKGPSSGSLHVLSLGAFGEIVLSFGPRSIADGPGPDLVVFENAFYAGEDASTVFAEPGEVAVSADGETFFTFDCQFDADEPGKASGCAGVTPAQEYDPETLVPLRLEQTGGDGFDLAEVGLSHARFVRIRDLSGEAAAPSAGFDLDAVGIINE